VAAFINGDMHPVTLQKKREFAVALLKDTTDPWQAARSVWPHDTGRAVWCYHHWKNDPDVLAYVAAVHGAEGRIAELPTSHEYMLYLWKCAHDAPDEDTRIKYLRLYAETAGELKRPQGADVEVSVTQNRVMIVNNLGTDEEWEEKAKLQQQQLQRDLIKVAEAVDYEEV